MLKINYRKRVPRVLVNILNRNEITKVCTKSEALKINISLEKAIVIMEMDIEDKQKYDLVYDILEPYISKSSKKTFYNNITYNEAVELYLQSNKKQISHYEYECKRYFFLSLFKPILTYLIGDEPLIKDIQAIHLNRVKNIICNLPSRNKKKYKSIQILDLVKKIDTNRIVIPNEDKLSITTINKHLKRLTSLSNFGKDSGIFNLTTCNLLIKNKAKRLRESRDALSIKEIKQIISKDSKDEVSILILLSFYSGMRLSEIPKVSITYENNIPCFDLTDSKLILKTGSSYRKIPIHKELMPHLEVIKKFTYKHLLWLARRVKKRITETIIDNKNKSLYSLRHSFATELISKNINPAIVSELMGHSQKSLTLSIYTKQFPLKILQESINLLNLIT